MRLALFWSVIAGLAIPLTVLYERRDSPRDVLHYSILIKEALRQYTKLLGAGGVELQLQLLADYTTYAKHPQLAGLVDSIGTDMIRERVDALSGADGNFIILVATPDSAAIADASIVDPCKSIVVAELSSEHNVATLAIAAVQRWLSQLIGVALPDPFAVKNSEHLRQRLSKVSLSEELKQCSGAQSLAHEPAEKRIQRPKSLIRASGPTDYPGRLRHYETSMESTQDKGRQSNGDNPFRRSALRRSWSPQSTRGRVRKPDADVRTKRVSSSNSGGVEKTSMDRRPGTSPISSR